MFSSTMIVEYFGFHLEGSNKPVKGESRSRAIDSSHPPTTAGIGAYKGAIECPVNKATHGSDRVATAEN
jgi:hypothetical protein